MDGRMVVRATALAAVLALAAPMAAAGTDGQAASGADGLRESLARVPAALVGSDTLVGYVDHRAVAAARPGAATPSSLAELMALLDADDPSARLRIAAAMGIMSGQVDLLRGLFQSGPEWPTLVGFDFFDIDRQVSFGNPPAIGLVLLGDFDPDAVGRAHEARGYVGREAAEHMVWCAPEGCETGLTVDLERRAPGVPFGGDLGRAEPVAVSGTDILSSADIGTLEAMLATAAGETPSLAERPDVAALLGALDPDLLLVQATLASVFVVAIDPASMVLEGDADAARERFASLEQELGPLPPWGLALLADGATADEQVVQVLLTYGSVEDAEVAAEVVPNRLGTVGGMGDRPPLTEALERVGVTGIGGRVVPDAEVGAVAVIELRAPLAGDAPDPEAGALEPSSRVYQVLLRSIWTRDSLWLAPLAAEG
jgi:hypothetical protein